MKRRASRDIKDFESFWLYYLRAHRKESTRLCHYAGAAVAFAVFIVSLFVDLILALFCPLIGLGIAVMGHILFERNAPTLLRYPYWSILSGLRMQYLWFNGKLEPHLVKAYAVPPASNAKPVLPSGSASASLNA